MAKYYNKTNAPLTLGLRDGSSTLVASKKWIAVQPHQDGSADLIKKVQKGYLIRKEGSGRSPSISKTDSSEKVEVVEKAPAKIPEPEPKPEPVPEPEPVFDAESLPEEPADSEESSELDTSDDSEKASDAPVKKRKRRKKI